MIREGKTKEERFAVLKEIAEYQIHILNEAQSISKGHRRNLQHQIKEDPPYDQRRMVPAAFEHLSASKFRSSFHLKQKDIAYIKEKRTGCNPGACQGFYCQREAPAVISNDGKQTPMRGIRFLSPSMQRQPAAGSAFESGTRYLVGCDYDLDRKELSHYDSQM